MAQLLPIDALGTQFWIEIWDDVPQATLDSVRDRVECLLFEFEQNYSRFKPDSYISRLNRDQVIHNPTSGFVNILEQGLAYFDMTGGILNMMVGEKLVASGYDADYSFQATNKPIEIPNPHDAITISANNITRHSGQIDIGGFGKGIAIDKVVLLLQTEFGLQYFLINGGGDMFGTSEHGHPITLYLEHPTQPQTYLGTTTIMNQGFAASSPHKRTWVHADTTYHHIIDTTPGSIQSHNKPDASFIIGNSATQADVFATVALLIDNRVLLQFAEKYELGVATFTLPTTIHANQAFNVQAHS